MRRFIVLLILSAVGASFSAAQFVTIPDPNMVTALTNFYPTCMSGNQLDTTCALVVNSNGMSLYGKNISNFEGLQYFDNATILDISNNPATTLTVLPPVLVELTAEDIPLTALPTLPATLEKLTMKNNFLTSLPTLPAGMTDIWVEANDLASLPTLPSGLLSLQVHHNNITALPALPAPLMVLNVYNNQIATIPTLPSGLQVLNISVNQVSTLPTLPNTLNLLDISNNSISSLPAALPPNLQQFHCGSNQLSALPASLPSTLWNFSCGYNSITSIPALPSTVTHFYCQDNQLTSIPSLPAGLLFLFCQNNQITSLPALPSPLINVNCSGNQISCFPTLPPNSILTLFPNPATCLPNYTSPMNTTLLSYPLCVAGNATSNPNGCLDGTGIYGTIFEDMNSNCLFDGGETPRRNVPVELRDGGNNLLQRGFSTSTGAYYLNAPAGSHTVKMDTADMPWVDISCAGGNTRSVTLSAVTPVVSAVDFETGCGTLDDFAIRSINHAGLAFPGTTHALRVTGGDLSQWFGFNCGSGASGQIVVTVTGPVTYAGTLAGSQTPSVGGLTFTYTVADFGSWDFDNSIGLLLATDTTAQAGNSVCVSASLTTSANDANLANNGLNYCYPVVNSFDPNMKESHPTYETDPQGYITYMIHFQNNGTAPARLVKLVDTLDAGLDWSTFEPVGYSHYCEVNLNGSVLNVRYPNINLIDSATNYAASQGYFQFRIKPVPTLEFYKQIFNKADIFFDFNPPITTNTTLNWLNYEIGFEEKNVSQIRIFPNPSGGMFQVESLEGKPFQTKVMDLTGKILMAEGPAASHAEIDLSDKPAGVYLLEVKNTQGRLTYQRLIKQ